MNNSQKNTLKAYAKNILIVLSTTTLLLTASHVTYAARSGFTTKFTSQDCSSKPVCSKYNTEQKQRCTNYCKQQARGAAR